MTMYLMVICAYVGANITARLDGALLTLLGILDFMDIFVIIILYLLETLGESTIPFTYSYFPLILGLPPYL